MKEEQTTAYSVEIWKRFRKWGGIPTAIAQNVKDLLVIREVENIFENSDFVLILNQAAGEGLIFYRNVVLPFVDSFPTNTELYRIMTTKPGEITNL